MKSPFLSIFSDTPDKNSATDAPADRPVQADHLARYYAFLNQQVHQQPSRRSNAAHGAIRFVQALFSFALFLAMFLTILTLFGFGLTRLGVIAQVSPNGASASSKQSDSPENPLPSNTGSKKKMRGKK